jgi:hypothetical protein
MPFGGTPPPPRQGSVDLVRQSSGAMSTWRPLSQRGRTDAVVNEPVEGLPDFLHRPVFEWVISAFTDNYHGRLLGRSLSDLQLRFQLSPPLTGRVEEQLQDLLRRMEGDGEWGLDVLDYMLHHIGPLGGEYVVPSKLAEQLARALYLGGSAWEVVPSDDGRAYQLSRRAVGPVREVIGALPPASRAHRHLVTAWNKLSGRTPDPSGAYREAVRAVEAAAKPVVTPKDQLASLGKMIAAMRDKPEKWETTLGTVDDVRRLMESVWIGQLDRHGTDDESVPLNVSPQQADAAVHTCLTLVRLFVGDHVRSVA